MMTIWLMVIIAGVLLSINGNTEQAIKEYKNALKYNPNYWEVYWENGGCVSRI